MFALLCLISLSIMSSGCIHVAAGIRIFFLRLNNILFTVDFFSHHFKKAEVHS